MKRIGFLKTLLGIPAVIVGAKFFIPGLRRRKGSYIGDGKASRIVSTGLAPTTYIIRQRDPWSTR